jgi:hypothetical protein
LAQAGFHVMNLANNHILDCGAAGLEVTLRALDKVGLSHFGAGTNLTEATHTVIVERKGYRIALLGVCDSSRYYAGPHRPGVAPLEDRLLSQRIRAASKAADLVVMSVHADLEFSSVPSMWRQRFSRWAVTQGAHLVIQHHPHVLQGIEEYKDGLIAYSLGNFVFRVHEDEYQRCHPNVADSGVLIVEVNFASGSPVFSWRVAPLHIAKDNLTYPAKGEGKQRVLAHLQDISSLTCNRSDLRRHWHARCRQEATSTLFQCYYTLRRRGLFGSIAMMVRLLKIRQERRWIRGLITFGWW